MSDDMAETFNNLEKVIVDFQPFPKIPRLNREIIITEKIDGTNAQVHVLEDGTVLAASRTRYITPEDDNFGFARWVKEHEAKLRTLGPGRHYGEWWGQGIQRKYGLTDRRFSLFNVSRWNEELYRFNEARHDPTRKLHIEPFVPLPACCSVVPILFRGNFDTEIIHEVLDSIRYAGSVAAPGFLNAEGIMVYHTAAHHCFKVTITDDQSPKGNT